MLYLIYAEDVANSLEQRLAARPAHLARLQQLKDRDRLVVAGPNPITDSEEPNPDGFSGSVIIAEFPSLAEAKSWADKDPYIEAGVYHNVTVKPFKRVF
ncbi:YciI family protein [Budvicia aquatica]|uniref:YciI family protein n=1 Tax=Budvicia aquatica TaxID=82979 RepID=UPI0021C43155|nr:YciI family protein [Budvicia aquatica]